MRLKRSLVICFFVGKLRLKSRLSDSQVRLLLPCSKMLCICSPEGLTNTHIHLFQKFRQELAVTLKMFYAFSV